jgi:hypothetical protein
MPGKFGEVTVSKATGDYVVRVLRGSRELFTEIAERYGLAKDLYEHWCDLGLSVEVIAIDARGRANTILRHIVHGRG